MITLYRKDATNFENNGLGSLDQNIINPEISWVDNGAFTLEFKYPLFAKHGKEIENSSIIKANDADGSNLFFVYKVTPSMGYLTVLCYQISYKLAFNSINDTNIVEKNGQMALNQLSNATQYPHQFKFFSDIQTVASSRVVRKNPIEFLLDTSLDNNFTNRWGGHIVRQNFNISVNTAYGSNKGYTIRHKKDLIGYEAEFDESTVITRIRPIGYDGLLLPEIYVDSPLISSYPEPRIQQVEYSNVKVVEKAGDEGFETKELAYAELRRLAKLEFSKNKVDLPDFSAKVEFVNLKQTDEYKDLQTLKQIKTGDTVKVIHAEDNFEIQAQMVEYKFNPLNNSYISITLGNYSKSFTSTVSKVSTMQDKLDKVATQSQDAWTAANGKNTVYSLSSFPQITASSAEGDLLYLKNGDKIELWILEKVNGKLQWVLQVSDATQEELKAQIKDAQLDIADAVKSANDAVDKANQNIKEIGELDVKLIDTKELTNKAIGDATKAIGDAKTAYDKTIENSGKIVTANQEIDKVKGEITQKVSQIDFDKSVSRITKAESSITQNANAITQKVSSIDVENILTGKAYATKSEVVQTSNSLTSTIAGVQSNLDNLTLGGVNILATTTDAKTFQGQGIVNQWAVLSYLTKTRLADYNLKVGDKVSFSCICEISGSNFGGVFTPRLRTSWTNLTQNNASYSITKAETIKFTCTFIMTESRLTDGTGVDFRADNVPSTVSMKWSEVQLEVGDKPTGYAPAPEEKANQIQVTQLSQDLNGFKTTVSDTYLTKADASTTYPTKTTVTSQISQSATDITNSVQSWTNGKLTSYSTTQQTNNSITNAVSDKADRSQVTQLSDQITSTVTGLTNESMITVDMIKGAKTKHPNYPDMIVLGIPATSGETYIVSTNKPNRGTKSAPIADIFYTQALNAPPSIPSNGAWSGHSVTTKAVINRIYLVFRNANFLNSFANGEYWVKVIAAPASQSQITQLSTDINLRVSKGDVTSQINLESGRVLIDTNQLLLNASTVKFSGSAFIPDAMIQNLTASKINVGTLNGANVNIINLNASNISAGTITGPNLSINLNSGEVLFQKGIIKRQDGNFSVDITNGILESYTSSGGYTLRDGEISFRDTSAWKPNSREKYGGIGYNNFPGGIWSGAVSGISVRGNEGWAIGTSNSDVGGTEATKGSLIAGGLERATFAAKKQITITAGDVYKNSIFSAPPAIQVGTGNSSNEILISSKLTTIGNVLVSELRVDRKATISQSLTANSLNVTGSKNAIHATRNGVRATPAYETAESYLGDIGSNYTREDCEVWIDIDKLFSDTVNTDIAYQVFLQAYDDTKFWVADFKSDKFLIKSDKPLSRFAWEIKAKRRGYENDRLVLQDDFDNEKIEEAWREK